MDKYNPQTLKFTIIRSMLRTEKPSGSNSLKVSLPQKQRKRVDSVVRSIGATRLYRFIFSRDRGAGYK